MIRTLFSAGNRWFPMGLLFVLSCAASARTSEQMAGPEWPREIQAEGRTLVVYEPQLETFRGNRMTSRAAVSIAREGSVEPVFGGIWLDATLSIDPQTKIAEPLHVRVTDVRFPNMGAAEAARLRQDIADDIPRWKLSYSVDDLLAELKLVEEQKSAAEGLKADVPRILFRESPAVLLSLQDEPAWRKTADGTLERLENSDAFVVRNPGTGLLTLHIAPFWWTSQDLHGPWQAVGGALSAITELLKYEAQTADPDQDSRRPDVIPVTGAAELVWTDGPPQYVPLTGTNLLYIKNTDSDVFLEIETQRTYALFSGRWYRTPKGGDAWEFVASDGLPVDFSRIPLGSEKRHVLACVAGTPQAQDAVRDAQIPQTEAVKPGPAPELEASYDGAPQFTEISSVPVQYAANTPYAIFRAESRYYWCLEGIWYDSDFAVGPWFVCARVPRVIYLIPPSCPYYYVTYCRVFSATPAAVYVGYYPGYRGCYPWRGSVVYGTGWNYRPWTGVRCYPRPVTWGLGVRYSSVHSGWSVRVGVGVGHLRRPSPGYHSPRVQAGVGGHWGGAPSRPSSVSSYRRSPAAPQIGGNSRPNLYTRQPGRIAPHATRPSTRPPQGQQPPRMPDPSRRDDPQDRKQPDRTPPRMPDPSRRDGVKTPPPRTPDSPRDRRDEPKAPPPQERKQPDRTPPRMPDSGRRDLPKTPPSTEREAPRTPPRNQEPPKAPPREVPKAPPRTEREAPRRNPPPPPKAPPQQQREAPKAPPRAEREAPKRTPPPPPRQERKEAPRSEEKKAPERRR